MRQFLPCLVQFLVCFHCAGIFWLFFQFYMLLFLWYTNGDTCSVLELWQCTIYELCGGPMSSCCWFVRVKLTTFVTMGVTGVLLQSKFLLIIYSTNSCGLIHYMHKRLRVVVASGMSLHQRYRSIYGGTVANTSMKWSLNVSIAFYA